MKPFLFAVALTAATAAVASAQSRSPAYLSEVRFFGSDFCPGGFTSMSGQLLPIADNPNLFSLLGKRYGGNETHFAVPAIPPVLTADRVLMIACMAVEGDFPPR